MEIAGTLGVTTEAVRAALDELADLALLQPVIGHPGEMRAVSPIVGLNALLAQAEADVRLRQRQIEDTRLAIASVLNEQQKERQEAEPVVRHVGPDAVRNRLEELAASVRHEILVFNPHAAQSLDASDWGFPFGQQAFARDVRIRAILQHSFRNNPQALAYASWFAGLGGELRCMPATPPLMAVYDGETALVPIDVAVSARGLLEIRSPGAVAVLHACFQQAWAAASEFGGRSAPDDDGLAPLEHQLIRLLAEGQTDEGAGREMSLSTRTVRRMMANLMTRLDARSRFQAGIRAATRGWL
ncbi:helix-turn-helix transcriptional regulator [Micromonospora sp. NPDC048170]|uniref:helix-turn-helix transcriptional regulator n=1 Tax=Micromonospora sp. NPDC048170 TaxID=3154819 RepID=UPI0033E218B5